MPRNPVNRILVRMFFYGLVLGVLMSGLVLAVLELTDSSNWSIGYLWTFLRIGAIFGGLSGLFSGMAIMIVVEVFRSRHVTSYVSSLDRIYVGIATVLISGIILLAPFGGLSFITHNKTEIALIGFLMSIGIAIYASQHTVTLYLREIDVRKKKVGE